MAPDISCGWLGAEDMKGHGCELNPRFIETLRADGFHIVTELNHSISQYDAVLMFQVLEHLIDPYAVLKSLVRSYSAWRRYCPLYTHHAVLRVFCSPSFCAPAAPSVDADRSSIQLSRRKVRPRV